MSRPYRLLAVAALLALAGSGCGASTDESDARAVVEELIAQSVVDDGAALALTDAPSDMHSCLAELGGLREAVVDETVITGDQARADVTLPVDGVPTTLVLALARDGDSWRVLMDDALSMSVQLAPEGVPMDLDVASRCMVPGASGTVVVAAPPGAYRVSAVDPAEVVFTADVSGLFGLVELPGDATVALNLDAARPGPQAQSAVNRAVTEVLTACADAEFAGLMCPSAVRGADSDGGQVSSQVDVELTATPRGWTFSSAPLEWRVGFVGDDDWRVVDVVVRGALSTSSAGDVIASIHEVDDAP